MPNPDWKPSRKPMIVMAVLTALTWSAVGYDTYDQNYGRDRSDSVTINIPDQVTHHTPLVSLSTEQTKRLNLLRALAANWNEYPYKEVFDRAFNDESVLLDGRNFIHCTFTNTKLIYEGTAPFRIEESTFPQTSGPYVLGSDNPIVLGVMNALSYQGGGQCRDVPSLP